MLTKRAAQAELAALSDADPVWQTESASSFGADRVWRRRRLIADSGVQSPGRIRAQLIAPSTGGKLSLLLGATRPTAIWRNYVVPTDLVFIRHGRTAMNAERRMAGWTDSPLSEEGLEQARHLAAHVVRHYTFDRVYCSTLVRTLQTARPFADPLGLEPVPLDDLREMFFGEFEGLTTPEIVASYPDTHAASRTLDDRSFTWPGGESLGGFFDRVLDATMRIVRECPSQRVAVVTHGAVIGALVAEISGGGALRWRDYVPENCSITEIRAEGDALRLVSHDDWSFLPAFADGVEAGKAR